MRILILSRRNIQPVLGRVIMLVIVAMVVLSELKIVIMYVTAMSQCQMHIKAVGLRNWQD